MFLFSRLSARTPEVVLTILIFSLSSGVLGGILFYMDSAAPNVLADMTSEVALDMEVSMTSAFYNQNVTTVEEIKSSVAERDYVVDAEDVVVAQIYDYWEEHYEYQRKAFLGISQDALGNFPEAVTVSDGVLALNDNSCLVEESAFSCNNLEIGSVYMLNLHFYDANWNQVFLNLSFTVAGTFESSIYLQSIYPSRAESTYLHLITTKDAVRSVFSMLGPDYYNGISDKIWVRFDKAQIAGADAATMADYLRDVKSAIEQTHLPLVHVRFEDFALLQSVFEYSAWFTSIRTIALSFSMPAIIMGIMLVRYNGRLVEDARRRDVGTLKTRGASGWQAFSWVLTSALVVGFIGSLGAILTGILGALLSGSVRELLVFDPRKLQGFGVLLQPLSVASVFLFSFSVGLLVAIPAAVKALMMSAVEAHRVLSQETLTEKEKMGSASVDILAVAMSSYLLLSIFGVMASPYYSSTSLFMAIVLIPLLAIFLFFFTRLFARHTARVKSSVLKKLERPSGVVGSRLASRTVMMFKKSETIGTMFIAMVFIAGFFVAISSTTGTVHMNHVYMFETGGDLAVEFNSGMDNITLDILDNMTRVNGVQGATPIMRTTGQALYWQASPWGARTYMNRTLSVFGVEPDTWLDTAFWLDYFTLEGSPRSSVLRLSEPGSDSISGLTSFRPVARYETDSSGWTYYPIFAPSLDLQLFSSGGWNNITQCEISDVLASRRDDSYSATKYLTGEPDEMDFVVVNIDYMHQCLNTSSITKVILKTTPRANYTRIMAELFEIAPHSISTITSAQEKIDNLQETRSTQTVYGAYTLNLLFSLVYLTFGMAIVSTVRVRNLRKQFSILRALGTDSSSIMKGFLVETAVGVILAAGTGAFIGVTLSFLVLDIPLVYTGTQTFSMWYRLPVLLQVPFILVTAIIFLTLTISQGTMYYVMRRTLNLNIAEEIQYLE